MNEFIHFARITSIYGLEGFLRIQRIHDLNLNLNSLKEVFIDFFGMKKKIDVEEVRKTDKSFILKFKRFDTVYELEVFIGRDVYVLYSDIPEFNQNLISSWQLDGAEVWRDNLLLGIVKKIMKLPANDVLCIYNDAGTELLIPLVQSFVENFDPENKVLVLKPGAAEYDDEN